MDSTLVITTPATAPLTLLSLELRRFAVGVADDSQDTALALLDARVAAAISADCEISVGGGGEPTLLKETLTETFRCVETDELILSRRHNVAISSITIDGVSIDAGCYAVDSEAGIVTLYSNGHQWCWCGRVIVVVYDAGFTPDKIPGDLQQAAMDFMRLAWLEKDRDPALKSLRIEVPGVQTKQTDYWIGSIPGQAAQSPVPEVVAGQLHRYRNGAVA